MVCSLLLVVRFVVVCYGWLFLFLGFVLIAVVCCSLLHVNCRCCCLFVVLSVWLVVVWCGRRCCLLRFVFFDVAVVRGCPLWLSVVCG